MTLTITAHRERCPFEEANATGGQIKPELMWNNDATTDDDQTDAMSSVA